MSELILFLFSITKILNQTVLTGPSSFLFPSLNNVLVNKDQKVTHDRDSEHTLENSERLEALSLGVTAVTTSRVEIVARVSACPVEMHVVGQILDEQSRDGLGHSDTANAA